MCPFWHEYFSLWTDWPWSLTFVQFYIKHASYLIFSPGAKIRIWHVGIRLLWKCIRKSKLAISEIGHFLWYFLNWSIANLKLKFWGYNEQNMGFIWDQKVLLLLEMKILWEHSTLKQCIKWFSYFYWVQYQFLFLFRVWDQEWMMRSKQWKTNWQQGPG